MLSPRMQMVRTSLTRVRDEVNVGTAARWNTSSAARSALSQEPANIILTRNRRMETDKVDVEAEETVEDEGTTTPSLLSIP